MTQFPYVHFTRLDQATHDALLAHTEPGSPETMSGLIRKAVRAYLIAPDALGHPDTQKALEVAPSKTFLTDTL